MLAQGGSRHLEYGLLFVYSETDNSRFFAHTAPEGRAWEPLPRHLQRVAARARKYASAFGSEQWGHLAGLWHDLGKYSDEFQAYLRSSSDEDLHRTEVTGRVDHSTAGAQAAFEVLGETSETRGLPLAYVIAGHHGGLPDWLAEEGCAGLRDRLKKPIADWRRNAPPSLLSITAPEGVPLPPPRQGDSNEAAFRAAFWIRMLFSALVDADFLATEAFLDPERARHRSPQAADFGALSRALREHLDRVQAEAEPTTLNRIRSNVLSWCIAAADHRPGFFTLSVPTGGGKTLASLAFALAHANKHGLRRVIVAAPFTTIIEQTADVFRSALGVHGNEVLLEHHSNLDPSRETVRNRLQSENWDMPVVVTTNVQLFESMFASRGSRCRKLHRIANSVIVLDEAQTIPLELMEPTLRALRELCECYGCTVVLCTATQPAIVERPSFPIGLEGAREIIPEPGELFAKLRRCRVVKRGILDDEALVGELKVHDQALCIVNTRAHAAALFALMGPCRGHFHLSTRMCAAHRVRVLNEIRERLSRGEMCRVVSTQLIEAGVDLDFTVVYRAPCGLDSLAQAAGRCNREGRQAEGEVHFFRTSSEPPPGHLRQTAQTAAQLIDDYEDLLSPEAVRRYFELHYWMQRDRWDARRVLDCLPKAPELLKGIRFRQMERRYRMIAEQTEDVLIPYGDDGQRRLDQFQFMEHPSRPMIRRLQRYTVGIRRQELEQLRDMGAVIACHERWILVDPGFYDESVGLRLDANGSSTRTDTLVV